MQSQMEQMSKIVDLNRSRRGPSRTTSTVAIDDLEAALKNSFADGGPTYHHPNEIDSLMQSQMEQMSTGPGTCASNFAGQLPPPPGAIDASLGGGRVGTGTGSRSSRSRRGSYGPFEGPQFGGSSFDGQLPQASADGGRGE